MLSDIWILTLGTSLAFLLFWGVPRDHPKLRRDCLTGVSAALVFLYAPIGFLFCCFLVFVPLAAQHVFLRHRKSWMFWAFVLMALGPLLLTRLVIIDTIVMFGVAFATVKSLGLVVLAHGGRQPIHPGAAALLIFFFPLFTVGPVERINTFTTDHFGNRFEWQDITHGLYRITIGLFLIMFICGALLDPMRNEWFGRDASEIDTFSQLEALGLVITSFLYTYLNFEGFTSVAIGISRLFGLRIVENFDRPLFVTNVADFWKRYHISMGNWINQNIYFPLVIWLKRPWASYVSTVVAFILFGMWHAFDLNYLVWGIGNGLGVALVHYGASRKILPLVRTPGLLKQAVNCTTGVLCLIYVGWLQTFANLQSFETGILLTKRLLFGH